MAISVIIPTLNEADCLPRMLHSLRAEQPAEIIVVDGGSTDGTCASAGEADRLLNSARGRAAQMNHGAAHAKGDNLLFLHADCILEAGALRAAERCLANSRVAAGCFRMKVAASGFTYRLIDACATARVRLTGLIYGDQGLFVQRRRFERIGGFPPVKLMEDVFISRSLRREGQIVVASRRILVSPRRWLRHGVIRQSLRNWTLTALAACGVGPDQLSAYYPLVR